MNPGSCGGFWILLGIVREFLSQGEIFGNHLLLEKAPFFSQSFQRTAFGFLAAGLALAFTNGILKKRSSGTQSLLLVVPAVIFSRPFEMVTFGGRDRLYLDGRCFRSAFPFCGADDPVLKRRPPFPGTAPGNAFYELYLSDTKYLLKQKDSVLFPAEMAGNREGPFLQGTLFLLS